MQGLGLSLGCLIALVPTAVVLFVVIAVLKWAYVEVFYR
jgi:hypothetical protein